MLDNLTEGLVNYYSQLWKIAKEPIVKFYKEPTPQMKKLAKLMPDDSIIHSEPVILLINLISVNILLNAQLNSNP